MKNHVLALLWLILTFTSLQLFGQCSVTSSNGYTVTFNIVQNGVSVMQNGGSCNYNVNLGYNIVYSGPNQSNLWGVNGSNDCIPDPDLGFSIPTTGSGTTSTYTSTYGGNCSDLILNCAINLINVVGPGIPLQTLTGCGNILYPVAAAQALQLPIELTSFSGKLSEKGVVLDWTTATETSNKGFEIEKSLNGSDWVSIGRLDGAGTSTEEQHYTFTDPNPQVGTNYYRLKQVDFDGKVEYSDVTSVNRFGRGSEDVTIYPNPAHNSLSFVYPKDQQFEAVLLFNELGQKVLDVPFEDNIDVSKLRSGLYLVVLQTQDQYIALRAMVQ